MDNIRRLLEKYAPISDAEFNFFISFLEEREFRKNDRVINRGDVENYLSFLSEGIVRLYYPDIDNETTFGIIFQDNFFSAYDSFLSGNPCEYEIECLTDSKLYSVSYGNLQKIYEQTQCGNEIGRKISENLFLMKLKRENDLLTRSATERYLNLFKERPELIRQIQLKYIASYIGITPQALSRIRREIF